MISTSKGFLETFIKDDAPVITEDYNLEEDVDLLINEDCGNITIGEWAFLEEGDVDDIKIQLLEEVLDEIDAELLEVDLFFENLELSDEDDIILDEAVGAAIKKGAKIVADKAKVFAKAAAGKAKAAGAKAAEKLKVAAKAAMAKAKEYAIKARDLAKKGLTAAADKAKAMASKLAAKARALKDKIKEAINRFKYRRDVIKKRKAGMPLQ